MNKLNERRGIIIYLENVGKNIVRETGEQPKESYALIQGTDSKKTVRKDFSLQKNVFQTKLKRRNNIIFTDKRKFNIYDSDKSSRTWRSRRKKLTLSQSVKHGGESHGVGVHILILSIFMSNIFDKSRSFDGILKINDKIL